MKLLTNYETVYLIKSDLDEENLLKLMNHHQGILVERGAKNILIENRGKRRLKYPINHFKDGIYIQMNYQVGGEIIELLERSLRFNKNILRYMTTSLKQNSTLV
jgi:small subunit ribosomal protein S6